MEAQDIQSAHEIQSVLEATHLNGQTSEEALESGLLTDSALQVGLAPSASSIALQAMGAPSAGGGVPSAAQQPSSSPGSSPGQAAISTVREARSTLQESSSMLLQAEYIMQQANGPPDSTPQQARQPAQHDASSAHSAPGAAHPLGRPTPQANGPVLAANGFMPGAAGAAYHPGSAMQPAGSGALQAHGPMQQRCFTEELAGVKACFQLVDLGRQIYIWAGTNSGAMGCMCLASPPPPTGSHAGHSRSSGLNVHMSSVNNPVQRGCRVQRGCSVSSEVRTAVLSFATICKAAVAPRSGVILHVDAAALL